MPVVTINTEDQLLAHLSGMHGDHDPWHIAVLHGSQMEPARARLLQETDSKMLLMEMSRTMDMASYICQDNDIVLLFLGKREDTWPMLREVFHQLVPYMSPADIDCSALFTVFELATQKNEVVEWLRKKYLQQQDSALILEKKPTGGPPWNMPKFARVAAERMIRPRKLAGICEDNRAQRQLAKSILSTEYDVVLACDGIEAITMYTNHAPDILFLDIHMPHMDGISVLDQIIRHDAQARVVMFSTQSSEAMLKVALDKGAKGFVTKPFTADALIRYARRTLMDVSVF